MVLGHLLCHLLGRNVDVEPQLVEQVEGPGGRGGPPVAVLAHGRTRSGSHEARHGRDVESLLTPSGRAPGTDDVDRAFRQIQGFGGRQHRPDEADRLIGGFALDLQGDQECGYLNGLGATGEDLGEDSLGFVAPEVLAGTDSVQQARPSAEALESHRGGPSGRTAAPTQDASTVTLGRTTPDTGVLPQRESVFEAVLPHVTASAHGQCPVRAQFVVGVRVEDRGFEAPACAPVLPGQRRVAATV